MTKEPNFFLSYISCFGKEKVQVADGTSTPLSGKGNVSFSPKITLTSVLHAPKMSCNLLSISKLTKTDNCSGTFFPNYCVFKDLTLGKMIGSAKERNGLYYLDTEEGGKVQAYQIKRTAE